MHAEKVRRYQAGGGIEDETLALEVIRLLALEHVREFLPTRRERFGRIEIVTTRAFTYSEAIC